MCLSKSRFLLTATLFLCTAVCIACSNHSSPNSVAADSGKIPITTKSDEARKEFLQGRDLSERLLANDSVPHFEKAIALDPEFASAELARANNSATAKDFFDHLKKAVALADKTSQGEKLLILAVQAGANADAVKQKDYLEKLVAAYSNDERALTALGNYHFGQQEFDHAIADYKKATELAPGYSPAFNILGYSYRQQGNYADAEQVFKKYVELIPNDPNPYDSYAELLLKMGKFEDSIAQYRKALSVDPHFVPSHFGIAADLMYMGKPEEATAELQKMAAGARNDGELRTALFGLAVVDTDRGKLDQALDNLTKQFSIAEKKNDAAAMAGDLRAKGNILEQMHRYDDAAQEFNKSLQLIEASALSQEIKDNAKLLHHYNLAAVAIGKKNYADAKSHAEQFRQGTDGANNPALRKQAHELAGRIALAEKDFDKAIAELQQANQQDPQNLYRLSQAFEAKGDTAKAREFCTKAAEFNSLPQLNYAFVRTAARKTLSSKKV